MLHFHLAATTPADDVMVVAPGDLVGQMSGGRIGGPYQSNIGKELKRSIHRWLRKTWQFLTRLFKNLSRREVRPFMTKYVQDRHSLWGHSVTAGAELWGIF